MNATTTSSCPGSAMNGQLHPYNAKGRPMHMTICPVCGREFRKQGRATASTAPTPSHKVTR